MALQHSPGLQGKHDYASGDSLQATGRGDTSLVLAGMVRTTCNKRHQVVFTKLGTKQHRLKAIAADVSSG